jgi:protein involved in polysaccharide export with SLBB domain
MGRSFAAMSLVFKRVIFILGLACLFSDGGLKAQTGGVNGRWSNSAKSLTIFQPGDAVRIRVWQLYEEQNRNINLDNDYPINNAGFIIMPLIGEIKVRGLTVYELMNALTEKLKQYLQTPYVEVHPLIRLTMQGAFNRPGSYRVDPSSSLWDLVAEAGGPAANCDLKKMVVERGGKAVIKDLLKSFENGYSLEEVGIESGDQIIAFARRTMDLGILLVIINLFASMLLLYLRLRLGGGW